MIAAVFVLFASQASFDIPNQRADAARDLLRECLQANASAAVVRMDAELAFEIARKQCWTLRTDYRDTLGPVAERHLQKKGVKHYAQDVVDLIADETFDLSVKRIEDGVLAEVSPR